MSDAMPDEAPPPIPLSIVVPVYLNAGTLHELAERVRATLANSVSDYRLIFVVDASPDESWAKVNELASTDTRVSGILLPKNVGQHRALLTGLSSLRAEMYAILDADLQDPPEHLKTMVEHVQRHGESVFAGRVGSYQSWGRMLTSRAFKRFLGWLLGLPTNVGTYLVIPDTVTQSMLKLNISHPQVVVLASHCSPSWHIFPYRRETRSQGCSAYSTLGRVKAAWLAIRCIGELRR